jgi:hypothetical protein
MAKEEATVATEPKKDAKEVKELKLVRCFYRKFRTKVILIPAERRLGQSRNEGVSVTFRKSEAFVPEQHIALLKQNKRYGIDYLTQEDLIAKFRNEPEAAEQWWDEVRRECSAHGAKAPILPSRY